MFIVKCQVWLYYLNMESLIKCFFPKMCIFKKNNQNLDIITNRFFQTKIDFQNPDFCQILYVFQIPFSIICKE